MSSERRLTPDEVRAWREQLAGHPGRLASERWRSWGLLVAVLIRNQEEFVEHLELPDTDPRLARELIQNQWAPDVAEQYQAETYRLFHNYLAAVSTLVDHSRILVEAYPDQADLQAEYAARIEQIKNDPVAKFVQELRNFYLHERLPNLRTTVRFATENDGGTTFEHTLRLHRDDLLDAKRGWTRPARSFLKAQNDTFLIVPVVLQYAETVESLCDWLGDQFHVLHRDDIAEYNQRAEAFNNALGMSTQPLPTWEEHVGEAIRRAKEDRGEDRSDSS